MKLHTAFSKLPEPVIYPWGQSYKPAVDDLWHPLSPAHGLPRILASEKILFYFSERDQGAPPSPSRSVFYTKTS
jgi:hypothetical protein